MREWPFPFALLSRVFSVLSLAEMLRWIVSNCWRRRLKNFRTQEEYRAFIDDKVCNPTRSFLKMTFTSFLVSNTLRASTTD